MVMHRPQNLLFSAPWVLPVVCVGLFLHKHFICDNSSSPADARQKAAARRCSRRTHRASRRRQRSTKPPTSSSHHARGVEYEQDGSQEQQLADAALGAGDALQELYFEDEVEALHQAAQSNPQALLNLLQQYGSRMVAEGLFDEGHSSELSEGSMWYTDDPDHSWQHNADDSWQHGADDSWQHDADDSIDGQQQYNGQQQYQGQQDNGQQYDGQQHPLTDAEAGQHEAHSLQHQQRHQQAEVLLHQLAAALQQQQQQGATTAAGPAADAAAAAAGTNAAAAADAAAAAAAAEGSYFDDSHWGLPSDPLRSPQDLQELQAAVTRNLEALLPKDRQTWTGSSSYPPHFDELLSPSSGPAAAAAAAGPPAGFEFEDFEPDFEPEFDLDDPGFDFVPDCDFDPGYPYDPEFEAELLDDMLGELELEGFEA